MWLDQVRMNLDVLVDNCKAFGAGYAQFTVVFVRHVYLVVSHTAAGLVLIIFALRLIATELYRWYDRLRTTQLCYLGSGDLECSSSDV